MKTHWSSEGVGFMRKCISNAPFALPVTMTLLALASWETIVRRSLLMAQGTCSLAEYQRMVEEKAAAARSSAMAILKGESPAAVMAPFVRRARSNARRLRK
jgi:hypothetical protein